MSIRQEIDADDQVVVGSSVGRRPVYRMLSKGRLARCPTVVVAGPDRRRAWLYVHGPTPTVLRLHRPVVAFLLDALAELDDDGSASIGGPRVIGAQGAVVRILEGQDRMSYPTCVVIVGPDRDQAWLHVLGTSPSRVRLRPGLVEFLRDALADLPAGESIEATPPVHAVGRYVRAAVGQ